MVMCKNDIINSPKLIIILPEIPLHPGLLLIYKRSG